MIGDKLVYRVFKSAINFILYACTLSSLWHILAPERYHWLQNWQFQWALLVAGIYTVLLILAVKIADKIPQSVCEGKGKDESDA